MLGGIGCATFAGMKFERPIVGQILAAMARKLPLLQVLVGPRQVGKTTAASHHLAPQGMAGFVLANGSMFSNQSGEGETWQN